MDDDLQALVKPGVIRRAVDGGDDDDDDKDRESGSARRRKKGSAKGKGAGAAAGGGGGGGGKGGKNKKGVAARGDRSSAASLMQDAAQVPDLTMLYVACGVISFLLLGLFFWIYRTIITAA